MDPAAIFDERAAVSPQAAQLRIEAARLRGEIHRSAEAVLAAAHTALLAAETGQALLEHAQICGAARSPCVRRSLVDRLEARLASLPSIEQAKGVLMAQQGSHPDEAFEILRRASHRTNMPVRELAQHVVADQCTQPGPARTRSRDHLSPRARA
jgi:hypothetical protein